MRDQVFILCGFLAAAVYGQSLVGGRRRQDSYAPVNLRWYEESPAASASAGFVRMTDNPFVVTDYFRMYETSPAADNVIRIGPAVEAQTPPNFWVETSVDVNVGLPDQTGQQGWNGQPGQQGWNRQTGQQDGNRQPGQQGWNGQPGQPAWNGQPGQPAWNGQPGQQDGNGQPGQQDANIQPLQQGWIRKPGQKGSVYEYFVKPVAVPYDKVCCSKEGRWIG